MWLWRKVLNITWSNKVGNEEVLRRVSEERAIISVINRRQRVWLGQILHFNPQSTMILFGKSQMADVGMFTS